MPSKRKKNKRSLLPKFYILCEGTKTEPNYFRAAIRELGHNSKLVDVQVVDTKKNSAKELVVQAAKLRETEKDEMWVTFDKDGYSKHPQAFDMAKGKNVEIAFSSISFETWILMHFSYTARAFNKSEDVISHLKKQHSFNYEKNDESVYTKTKSQLKTAIKNAKKLNETSVSGAPAGTPIYNLNPYTDVYKLLDALGEFRKEWCK